MAAKIGVTFCGKDRIGAYEAAIRSVGLEPVRLVPGESVNLDGVNGLLLTGGVDVNPRRYGQEPAPETQPPDDARDRMEAELLGEALAVDLPVFAICRGIQMLNVHLHGTLVQHLSSALVHEQRIPGQEAGKHRSAHKVKAEPGTLLERTVGEEAIEVNSRHHQAIDQIAPGLVVSARSEDGVIEAVELPSKRFVLGVQWHPEDRVEVSAADRALFEAFAAQARSSSRG